MILFRRTFREIPPGEPSVRREATVFDCLEDQLPRKEHDDEKRQANNGAWSVVASETSPATTQPGSSTRLPGAAGWHIADGVFAEIGIAP